MLVKLAIKRDIESVTTSSGARLKVTGFGTFKNRPYSVVASPEPIRGGFDRDLQALQGRNRTYYAGAAHQTHSSASNWSYVDDLLPSLSI